MLTTENYTDYLEPLGTVKDLSSKYNFIECNSVNGQVYTIPVDESISGGIIYDKAVLKAAGINDVPQTPEQLEAALKSVKEKTDAVPMYSSFRDSSVLSMWQPILISMSGDKNYINSLIHKDNPFEKGDIQYRLYKTLYDITSSKLLEKDPNTSYSDGAVRLFKEGKLGAAVAGLNMYDTVKKSAQHSEDIVYMPFKSEKDGKLNLVVKPGSSYAINVNSKNKKGARAWLNYLIDESGYTDSEGSSWVLKKKPEPDYVKEIKDNGINIITPAAELGAFHSLDNKAMVGLSGGILENKIIDTALTGSKTYDEICQDINDKWKKTKEDLEVK